MVSADTQERTNSSATNTSRASTLPSADATLTEVQNLLERGKSSFASDTSAALLLSQQALALVETLLPPNDSCQFSLTLLHAGCLSLQASCLERQSHFEAAIEEGKKALALLEPLRREDQPITPEFISTYSQLLHMIGNAHQRRGGHFESLDYYQTELRFLETMGAIKEQVGTRNALASVSYSIGDYPAAMESALQALSIAEETGHLQGRGSALNLLGNLYFKRGDNTAAIDSYERSLAVFADIGDLYWQAGVMGNCANVCLEVGDHDRALEMHYASLHLRREVGDRQGQAYSVLNLGSFYMGKQGASKDTDALSPPINPALSLRFYKRALRLFEEVNDKQGTASCLVKIGSLYAFVERSTRALAYGTKALALAEEMGAREHLYESHLLLSRAYEQLKDSDRALRHHKEFHAVKEAVFNAENEERIRNLEVIHRVAQARRDTEIHRRLSGRLAVTNKALQAADSEKALLLIKLRQQAGLLEIQARTDALTGLLNRRTLDTRLQEEWECARRENSRLSIVLCDIDRFKQINDQFSHQVGDSVLRQVSRLFQQALRKTDTSARYGGEEFVFILPDTALQEASVICENIRLSVSTYDWSQSQPGLVVTVSLGLCEASVSQSDVSAEQALRVADTALYEAKHQGRNRLCHAVIAAE